MKTLTIIPPEIKEIIVKGEDDRWYTSEGIVIEKPYNPIDYFEVVDQKNPERIHYICKYGFKVIEDEDKLKIQRIGFIEYVKEKSNSLA